MQENVCSFSHFWKFVTYLFKIFSEELYYFQTGKPFRVLLQDYELDCMNLLVFIMIMIKIIINSDIVIIVVKMIVTLY